MPRVNPSILSWARETAGFRLEEAAAKLGIREARGVDPAERLTLLERGEAEPSRPLLLRMAKQYRRPLLTFYLSEPPRTGDRGRDFRTLGHGQADDDEAILDALIRDVRSRQSLVRAALEEDEAVAPRPFVGAMRIQDGRVAVMDSIRASVGFSLSEFRSRANATIAFEYLRERAQDAGVFVLLQGNLGTHHTALSLVTFRGLALADPYAPFVVINDQDSRAAWSFTLVHELAHLWLGATGVSGGLPSKGIEQFCNDVASEFLLPSTELDILGTGLPSDVEALDRSVGEFAESRNVSRTLVAYKLFRSSRLTEDAWQALSARFREQWHELRGRRRLEAREEDGGPSYYVVRRHRLGQALIDVAARSLHSGSLPTSKVAQVLGVKPKQVGVLLQDERSRRAS